MKNEIRIQLLRIFRVNRTLYFSILAGMITLIVIGFILEYSGFLTQQALVDTYTLDRIMLMIVVVLLFLLIYLKRVYLLPRKLISRAEKSQANITTADIADLIRESEEEYNILAKALNIMRRYFMVIWSIGHLVILLAFTGLILTGNFEIFLIYSVVSLYSIAINFPRFALIENCFYLSDGKNRIVDK